MAPAASSVLDEISENKNCFEFIAETKIDGNISLSKYRSTRTGIVYFIADVKGPIVTGYLCLATEAFDDDGLPHTLEHLIFLGSESYPYKGVLDLLANRCLASGTNALTDVDSTQYTMTTAGSEGFLSLLPIYMDHILYPTLTDSAFTTEVYHVNAEGEDSGIVYCEVQARENAAERRCHVAMKRALYPGHCGYKSQTGGMVKNLRESTNNEKVRNYHKAFYRPENLCVIITGQVDAAAVFRAVQPMEEKILTKGRQSDFVRPWQSPVPPLETSLDQIVPYPCDDDEHGMVYVAWRGPDFTNFDHLLAVTLVMEYLTDTSVAPLQKEFVEIDDPFCGNVSSEVIEASVSCLMLEFENVPKEKLHLIKPKLLEVLKFVEMEDSLDMKRFAAVIYRKKLHILNGMENDAHDMIAARVIGDFLYGSSNEDLFLRMQHIPILDKLAEQKATFWSKIMRKYLVDAFMVVTIGEASPSLLAEMTEFEKARIAATRNTLGEEGMKKKEEELQKAIQDNEVEAPSTLLTSIDIPSIKSIHFHGIKRSCSYHSEADVVHVDRFPLANMPCHFQLDDIQSVFVQLAALLDTSCLSAELRLYLPLWTELILESPLLRNGRIIPYEEVVAELTEDTVCSSVCLGVGGGGRFTCGPHAQVVAIIMKVEPEKYHKGVNWLKEVLYDSQFAADRIAVVSHKMIKDVANAKRDGYAVASTLMHNMVFCPKSNRWVASPIRQQQFLTKVLQTLEANPQEIIDKLEELRRSLKELTIHMSGDVQSLCQQGEPCAPWTKTFHKAGNILHTHRSEPEPCYQLVQPLDCGLPTGMVAGIGAVESSFLVQTAPIHISYMHPDLPALLVLIQYVTQCEGPMWRQLRGQGLTYHYSIFLKLPEQLIYFILFKSSHIIRAYKEAKVIVESHTTAVAEWDDSLLEASRSSLMFEIIEKEKSVGDVSLQSVLAYLRNLDMDYNRKLLDLVSQVQLEDLKRVGPLYLTPLFDPSQSRCSICCHPSKVEEVVSGFKEMSRSLTVINALEESFLANFVN